MLVSRNLGQEPAGADRARLFGFNVATGRRIDPDA